ncbi:MAG: hypothetical protein IKD35_01320 [Clostridia bacterium]|nr:hypothetical protein [Clostridia bacterium]
MKKFLLKLFSFFTGESKGKNILQFVLCIAMLAVAIGLAVNDVVSNMFGAALGFIFSTLILRLFKLITLGFEDSLKINFDTDALLERYYKDSDYRKTLTLNGTSADFAYADTIINEDGIVDGRFEVEDDPEKMMELDDFIGGNFEKIFSAHKGSNKPNSLTVRLDAVKAEGGKHTLYLSRSTVYNHLVTNRAIDFELFDGTTLRDMFEYGPELSSFEDSKMSNHVGINGLVFLGDGNILVPHRNRQATMSKNKVTSSIAVKLNPPKNNARVTKEYFFDQTIIDSLTSRTRIPSEILNKENIEIMFLGFGQSVYEGGKPQFYFAVKIGDIDTAKYHDVYEKSVNQKSLDEDKCIYVADFGSFRFNKQKQLAFECITRRGKRLKKSLGYEMSYLANLWHYMQSLNE